MSQWHRGFDHIRYASSVRCSKYATKLTLKPLTPHLNNESKLLLPEISRKKVIFSRLYLFLNMKENTKHIGQVCFIWASVFRQGALTSSKVKTILYNKHLLKHLKVLLGICEHI